MNPRALRVALLLTLPAFAIHLFSALAPAALYLRADLQHGQLWRLWSGHWVHFSTSHLFWNVLVFLPVIYQLEKLRPGLAVKTTVLAAPLISLGLLAFAPAMHTYGGLSALNFALGTALALVIAQHAPRLRLAALATLALLVAKTAYEFCADATVFVSFAHTAVRPSALSHALGLLSGAALALLFPAKTSAGTSAPPQTRLASPNE